MRMQFRFNILTVLTCLIFNTSFADNNVNELTVIAGGDVEWSGQLKPTDYYFGVEDKKSRATNSGARRLPLIANQANIKHLATKYKRYIDKEKDTCHFESANNYIKLADTDKNPFIKLTSTLSSADITFVNLETPLSGTARNSGKFRTPTSFAHKIAGSGIDIVSTANNHAFDAEGEGIIDTIQALNSAGIKYVGTGKNIAEATRPYIFQKKGLKVAFLAYTYGVNPTSLDMGFATPNRSGAAPLDVFLIKEDIKKLKKQVDFIILSLHWGNENVFTIHPDYRDIAHEFVDVGANIIIGHHPHVPKGVESYNGALIAYSLGNFIFSHNHDYWGDNILLKMSLSKNKPIKAELIGVAGKATDLYQPFVLTGERAMTLLEEVKQRSLKLDTNVVIKGGIGVVQI